ncbi:GntR family transcriptional regulator [Paenibacillus sp. XY044]|uniref:GntR family transcriptional regulator n=1 Tax=Paenibacillus sp. XY044 TaxID=2026089 RepID=UPI00211B387E|nr:GntR family transcriptional regulator [Paenibacillus sp. XY044]
MVQEYVRNLITSQVLKVGVRIPTEKELMERFGVSKITVVHAHLFKQLLYMLLRDYFHSLVLTTLVPVLL